MTDLDAHRARITARLEELDARLREVDHELAAPVSADLEEQAIDIEDDEVLEGLGNAAQREVALLRAALGRIEAGTYGICASCEEVIEEGRLAAVPYAPLCGSCARGGVG